MSHSEKWKTQKAKRAAARAEDPKIRRRKQRAMMKDYNERAKQRAKDLRIMQPTVLL
jgi:hypothetical protein